MMHYLLSVYSSYEQHFSSREFEAFLNLKKSALPRTKKNFTSVF